MIAADPGAQGQGVGSALTEVASDGLRQSGMRVAMIETVRWGATLRSLLKAAARGMANGGAAVWWLGLRRRAS